MLPWLDNSYQQLAALALQAELPHAILLTGSSGVGKVQLAEALAALLLCREPQQQNPCGECKSCRLRLADHHADYWHQAEAEGRIGVDRIRQLTAFFQGSAQQGGVRIALLPQAERMSEAAANALLKTLEEPPSTCFLLLTSDQPAMLLPTITSRCQRWAIGVNDVAEATTWLQQQSQQPLPDFMQPMAASAPLQALHWLQSEQAEEAKQLLQQLEQYVQNQLDLHTVVKALEKSAVLSVVLSWFIRQRLPELISLPQQAHWQLLQYFQRWCRDETQILGQNKNLALTALLLELKRLSA
ncbi:DNA polymerase III subunit delta' [Alkalimonas collagenimarina]|uniref:DNA-directed DNA polymerase n=1 Tax=Alkalimonas collagenimarina TaxID=400390 RepID=A0ABT9H1Q9_9GAMM|nr:DNA polymerase III subunit delta' [Alkalimonas collagenimarina]MDP4537223.1 DNA polymerase III subunit delta' [Alkalimonas collagenimarina]